MTLGAGAALVAGLGELPASAQAVDAPRSPRFPTRVPVADGVEVFVQDLNGGDRGTILFVPGWPLPSGTYELQLSFSADRGFRAIAVDPRGFGRSDALYGPYTYDVWASDLHKVQRALGLFDVTVVGHFMCGAVALRHAARFGSGSANSFSSRRPPRATYSDPTPPNCWPASTGSSPGTPTNRAATIRSLATSFFATHTDVDTDPYLQFCERQCLDEASLQASRAGLLALRDSDLTGDTKLVEVPTRVFHALHDNIVPYDHGQALAADIAHARLITFTSGGHGIYIDETDRFNAELLISSPRSPGHPRDDQAPTTQLRHLAHRTNRQTPLPRRKPMATITVGRENSAPIDIYYEDQGSGPAVVLLSGWPFDGRSWEPQQHALLTAGHRVITVDRRGFGKSSRPSVGYNFDTLAADVEALLTELDLHDVTLVGFSLGTGEVVRYIGRFGTSRLRGAVIIESLAPSFVKSADNPNGVDQAGVAGVQQAILEDRNSWLTGLIGDFLNLDDYLGKRVSEETVRALWAAGVEASPWATWACVQTWLEDFHADIERIDIPTLIVHGTADRILSIDGQGRRLHAALPQARYVEIDGGPHVLAVTHAAELNAALLAFLSDPSAAATPVDGATTS